MKVIRAEWMNSTITPGVEINSIQELEDILKNNDVMFTTLSSGALAMYIDVKGRKFARR